MKRSNRSRQSLLKIHRINGSIRSRSIFLKDSREHFNPSCLFLKIERSKIEDQKIEFPTLPTCTLLEGLGPIPLPQARAASPIRTTSGILLSNMYPSHSGNLSFPWSGKYFRLQKDAYRIYHTSLQSGCCLSNNQAIKHMTMKEFIY